MTTRRSSTRGKRSSTRRREDGDGRPAAAGVRPRALPFELNQVDLDDDEVRLYEVTFERIPTLTERAHITPRFHQTLVPNAAGRVVVEWTWTPAQTVVRVDPHAHVPGLGRRIGEAFRAVNDVVPLVRVIGRTYS